MRTKLKKLIRFGVVGMAHAGKTTVCDAIIKELNRRFFVDGFLVGNVTRLKFAQPMYDYLDVLGEKRAGNFMQEISDVTKKYYGEDIYVRVAEQTLVRDRLLSLSEPHSFSRAVVCDDCRYAAELEMLKRNGFKMVFVEASEAVRKARAEKMGMAWRDPNHSSEAGISALKGHCDYILCNEVEEPEHIRALASKLVAEQIEERLAA